MAALIQLGKKPIKLANLISSSFLGPLDHSALDLLGGFQHPHIPNCVKFNIIINDHGSMQNCNFSVLDQKYLFEQVWSKNQNSQFNLKFDTQINLNVQNSIVMLFFSVFHWKYPFWANLDTNLDTKLKPGIQTNWNMRNSMVIFTFSVLDWNYPFWANSV